MDKYQKMHGDLYRLIPSLDGIAEHAKLKSSGFMDLSVNILGSTDEYTDLALSHYYEQNGDLVPDPDMEIRVWKHGAVEALAYQDTYGYQRVYHDFDAETGRPTKYSPRAKKELNSFLAKWLRNLLDQGHTLPDEPSDH